VREDCIKNIIRICTYDDVLLVSSTKKDEMCLTYRGSFPEVKRPERKVNHSPFSTVETKNVWSCISFPPIFLHVVDKETYTFACTFPDVIHWLFFKLMY